MSQPALVPRQRSFDDLGIPLQDVTFCVVDLETTGGSPRHCGITEIGAALYRGGECLGTFQTLVNPGMAIPPQITVLTGITEAMVYPAPRIEGVLPSLLEFVGTSVIVGHNVRFDLGFINAALERTGRPRLTNSTVDTVALARRLVRDEVPNCKLSTLADRFALAHRPSHRALDDVLATGDLLHVLLERAAGLGVTGLDDLLALPKMAGHPQAAKLRLTDRLPRKTGVYLFRDGAGQVLYVGKAANLRSRVRSYFSSDDRRKTGPLLRSTQTVDHVVAVNSLHAAVLEIRLIQSHEPHYNQQLKKWRSYRYLKLTDEPFPRLSVSATVNEGTLHLGPLPSTGAAHGVAAAIQSAIPLRRCHDRLLRAGRPSCPADQLGLRPCPCTDLVSEAEYRVVVKQLAIALTEDPAILLAPLEKQMRSLADQERYEDAASVRDRSAALASSLLRYHQVNALRRAGRVILEIPGGGGIEIYHGVLVRAWDQKGHTGAVPLGLEGGVVPFGAPGATSPTPRDRVDEMWCVARWIDQHADRLTLIHADRPITHLNADLRRFEVRTPSANLAASTGRGARG